MNYLNICFNTYTDVFLKYGFQCTTSAPDSSDIRHLRFNARYAKTNIFTMLYATNQRNNFSGRNEMLAAAAYFQTVGMPYQGHSIPWRLLGSTGQKEPCLCLYPNN
jgi:hypothetical protein